MTRYTDDQLARMAVSLLLASHPHDDPAAPKPGSSVWKKTASRIAAHLKWLQKNGHPLPPPILVIDESTRLGTAKLLRQVKKETAEAVIDAAKRAANGGEA